MHDNYTSGINDIEIKRLISKIMTNIERLEQRFTEIDMIVKQTPAYYESNSGDCFRSSYNSLRENYTIVKKNLLSYTTDFDTLISSYDAFATSTAEVYHSMNTKNQIDKYERKN